MTISVGVFSDMGLNADWLWSQCDGELGRDDDLVLRHQDRAADHVFCFNLPFFPKGAGRLPRWKRLVHKLRGTYRDYKAAVAFDMLATPRDRTSLLLYEPPPIARNFYDVGRERCARVWSCDEQAPPGIDRVTLPAFWLLMEDVRTLRAMPPRESEIPLAAIISGKTALPGHAERLAFLRRLRAAGVDLALFGNGLPADTHSRGYVASKGQVFRAARCTLAIENYDAGDLYVTEKLWDPLLSWSVPLYYGPRAADKLVPPECFIRLPDLADAGVETVRAAVADPHARTRRLDAIAEARRRCLEELRLPVWLRERLK